MNYEEYYRTLKQNRAFGTFQAYSYTVSLFREFLRRREPSQELAEEFLNTFHGNSPQSIARHIAALRHFFKWCKIPFVLESPYQQKKLPPYVSEQDFEKISDWIKRQEQSLHPESPNRIRVIELTAIVMLLWSTGLRLSELANLRDEDVSDDHVRVMGKGGRERVVPIEEKPLRIIREWIKVKPKSQWVFPSRDPAKPRPKGSIQARVKSLLKKVGLGRLKVHSFRHGAATALYGRGADLRYVQEYLGHQSLATTAFYVHLAPQVLKERLPKRFAGE